MAASWLNITLSVAYLLDISLRSAPDVRRWQMDEQFVLQVIVPPTIDALVVRQVLSTNVLHPSQKPSGGTRLPSARIA